MNPQKHQAEVGSFSFLHAGLVASIITGQQRDFKSAEETDTDIAEAEILHLLSRGIRTFSLVFSLFF